MPSPKSGKAGAAISPAAPEEALEADVALPGEVEKMKAEQRQVKTGKYGSTHFAPHKPPSNAEERALKNSWIEIEMVGEDDQPYVGEAFLIKLPDGSTTDGTLDEKGFARVEGIEPGPCEITFPNLDKEAWGAC